MAEVSLLVAKEQAADACGEGQGPDEDAWSAQSAFVCTRNVLVMTVRGV